MSPCRAPLVAALEKVVSVDANGQIKGSLRSRSNLRRSHVGASGENFWLFFHEFWSGCPIKWWLHISQRHYILEARFVDSYALWSGCPKKGWSRKQHAACPWRSNLATFMQFRIGVRNGWLHESARHMSLQATFVDSYAFGSGLQKRSGSRRWRSAPNARSGVGLLEVPHLKSWSGWRGDSGQ